MELAIISGKGGTGKSSISAAFASVIKNHVLTDCDVDAANMHILFQPKREESFVYISGSKAEVNYDICTGCGICSEHCRFGAITMQEQVPVISEVSCDGCFLCSRICPVGAIKMTPNDKSRMYIGSYRHGKMVFGILSPGEENSGRLVNMVKEKAREIKKENKLDHILLDGPPGIGCPVISTIAGADKVLIVTEPSLSGLHDLERAIEITSKFGIHTDVMINKFDLNAELSERIEERCKELSINTIGRLPFDHLMTKAMIEGKSITEYAPGSEISKNIKDIIHKILES